MSQARLIGALYLDVHQARLPQTQLGVQLHVCLHCSGWFRSLAMQGIAVDAMLVYYGQLASNVGIMQSYAADELRVLLHWVVQIRLTAALTAG